MSCPLAWAEYRNSAFTTIATAIVPALAWLAGVFNMKQTFVAAFSPIQRLGEGQRKNAILFVGLGRSGKSNLIKTLTNGMQPIPKTPTESWVANRFTLDDSRTNNKILLYINDYRGQELSQVISNFIKEQFRPNTPFRYTTINTLILMVDIFPEIKNENPRKQYKILDEDRIKYNLQEWSETALDSVWGMLTKGSLKSVILFINKYDKWQSDLPDRQMKRMIIQRYKRLHDDLEERAQESGAEFYTIIGSALTGEGTGADEGLRGLLSKHSVSSGSFQMKNFLAALQKTEQQDGETQGSTQTPE